MRQIPSKVDQLLLRCCARPSRWAWQYMTSINKFQGVQTLGQTAAAFAFAASVL